MLRETDAEIFLDYLASQETAQQFLAGCYQDMNDIDAEMKSYENVQAFIHYIAYGREMYAQSKKIPKSIQPILLFYGTCHMLKACLLTCRPDYPEQTSQLAHGASARKRKRKNYTFREDEVKVQHQGLFPYVSRHLFHVQHMTEEKLRMDALLQILPDMLPLFRFMKEERLVRIGCIQETEWLLPASLLDGHQVTWKTLLNRLRPHLPNFSAEEDSFGMKLLLDEKPHWPHGPYIFSDLTGNLYIPANKGPATAMPEVMVHYLLLYNLSMISRYETEWWGDLFALKSDLDYPLISSFLDMTAKKLPLLLASWLYSKK